MSLDAKGLEAAAKALEKSSGDSEECCPEIGGCGGTHTDCWYRSRAADTIRAYSAAVLPPDESEAAKAVAAGRAAATPDPPDMTNMCEGESPDHKPGITPAATPDERLREALRDANEYLAQIADYSPSEVADAIDSVRAQIKDALAATDSRGKPDGASVPDQSCATCGGSGDRNGNRRAADPFGTCPGCGGTGRTTPREEPKR